MNGNTLSGFSSLPTQLGTPYAEPKTMPVSPCEEAYARLRAEQEVAATAFARLIERLGYVLRDEMPMIGGGASKPEEAPCSEMHGRFLAAGDRARDLTSRIDAITDRLTI